MTQEDLNIEILKLQAKLSYYVTDDILTPASYGVFNDDSSLNGYVQLLKSLWRYKVDEEESNSCFNQDDVCKIIDDLNERLPFAKVPKKKNIEVGFTYSNHVFTFNLKDCDDKCECISNYKDVRVTLRNNDKVISIYSIDDSVITDPVSKPIVIVSKCTIGICLEDEDIDGEGLLTVSIEVNDDDCYMTVLKDHKLKILKNE